MVRTAARATRAGLIGRSRELEDLLEGLEDARAGLGRLFMVSGDAGIGKTRLLEALQEATDPTDARFIWGRCWEGGGAPAYWPWTQLLQAVRRAPALRVQLPDDGAGSASGLPQLIWGPDSEAASMLAASPPASDVRFRLFDAVVQFLKTAGEGATLVVALDDLHAADEPSLRLLQFLAGELAESHLLVVGTYRDSETRSFPHLHQLLGTIARRGRRIALAGLDRAAVSELLVRNGGGDVSDVLAREVHEVTDGNPFFVQEVARLVCPPAPAAPAPGRRPRDRVRVSVPEEAHEVIRRRLRVLGHDTLAVLGMASVLGREFDVRTLAFVSEQNDEVILDAVGDASDLDMVVEVGLGRWAFSHALLRETLYLSSRPSERVARHHRVASGLEALHARNLAPHLPALAHHFFEAAKSGDGTKAVHYCGLAADAAMASAGFEQAAELYRRAVDAMRLCAEPDERRRCELLIGLVEAHHRSGDFPRARDAYRRAIDAARDLRCPQVLARAALSLPWRGWASVDDVHLRVLEEARHALGDGETPLLARLLLGIAGASTNFPAATLEAFSSSLATARRLADEGLKMARRTGDRAALRAALFEWSVVMRQFVGTLPERKLAVDELMTLALEDGDRETLLMARSLCRVRDLFEAGEIVAMRHETAIAARDAENLRIPFYQWITTAEWAAVALVEGRFDDAEDLARAAAEVGGHADTKMVEITLRTQLVSIRRMQGRFEEWHELSASRSSLRRVFPTINCSRVDRALSTLELGRPHEARSQLEEMLPEGLEQIKAAELLCCATGLAELCWRLDDVERGGPLYDYLLPYADVHVQYGLASLGACARSLGQLATLLGRFDDAENHFRVAHRFHRHMEARAWLAHTQVDHARMLLQRRQTWDIEHGAELLQSARDAYRALHAPVYEERAARLLEDCAASPDSRADEMRPSQQAVFRREGEYWCIAFESGPVRVRDSKGLRYLYRLLHAPGHEVHALELVTESSGGEGAEHFQETDSGPVLDARAKAAYRQRLAELEDELDDAAARRDIGRQQRAQEEKEFLVAELASAVGLGGRDRRLASAAERARQSVTRAVKHAIERIAQVEPAAGAHLRSTVRTGIYSSYMPDPRVPITWED